jgi:hypothetical protein
MRLLTRMDQVSGDAREIYLTTAAKTLKALKNGAASKRTLHFKYLT